MEEQIIEILEKYIITPDDLGGRFIPAYKIRKITEEMTAHVMEFITWIRENQHQLFLEPTEDIYDYWLTQIYKH